MLRSFRYVAAILATAALAFSAGADAGVVSARFEARFTVVATCSVSVDRTVRVDVACASPVTPYRLIDAAAPALHGAGPDAQRVTVYF